MQKLFLFIMFATSLAQAQYGAISTATAGSGRATVEPSESPVLNPASIPFSRGYFFTSDYATMSGTEEFTVGLTDNMPDSVVPAAFIYNQVNGKSLRNQNFTTQDLRLEFANLIKKNLAFGMTVRSKTDSVLNTQYRQTNLLMGTIFALNSEIGLALVLDNLLGTNAEVPMDYRLVPAIGLGLNYNYKKVIRFRLDLETASNDSFNEPAISGGLEGHWNQWLLFRMGVRKTLETNIDEYGVGVGFAGPKFAFHYGYLSSPQQDKLDRHAVDLAIPIW